MGAFSPIHWLIVLLMLALFLLGPAAGFIMLVSHPKTRKATLIALAPLFILMLLVGGWWFVSGPTQWEQTVSYPATAQRQGIVKGDNRDLMNMYESVAEPTQPSQPSSNQPASSPQANNTTVPAAAPLTREEELSQAVASKLMSALKTTAMVLGRVLAEEEKILATKKGGEGTQPVLTQGETEQKQRPAWIGTKAQLVGDAYQMTRCIGPYSTRKECDDRLPDELQAALGCYVEACLGDQSTRNIRLPNDYLRQQLVKAEWEEVRPYSVGPMVQLHVLLQFDRKVKDRVLEAYRQGLVEERLRVVAFYSAVGLLVLAAWFAYLKIDLLTNGVYRGRLRFAVGMAILGVVVVVAVAWMA